MDHPLALDQIRPWRTTAVVASAIALLELVVIVVAGVAVLGEPLADKAKDVAVERSLPAAPKPIVEKPKAGAPKLARSETAVLVLNGNGRSGAAASAAERVHARGYVVGGTGNASRSDYGRSLVMYRAGFEPEARRFARDLKIKVVGPLDGMAPRELMGAHVAYILGSR